jgi:tRNA A-37 threonylcarbamoyl transferase component Bud32
MVGVIHADVAKVQKVLGGYWGLTHRDSVPSHVWNRVRMEIRSDAIIAHIPAFGDFPAAFLKIYSSSEALQNEVEGLERARLVSLHGGIKVPRILCAVPTENALLFEHLMGTNLGSFLRLALVRPYLDLCSIWDALACWLRAFHEVETVPSERFSTFMEWWSALTSKYLMGVVEIIRPSAGQRVSRVKNAIERAAFELRFPLVWCHGDLGVYNILICNRSVYVIDFAYSKPAPRAFDIERLFFSVQDAIGFVRVQEAVVRIRDEFMRHYGTEYALNVAATDAAELFLHLERLYFLNRCRESGSICPVFKRMWQWCKLKKSLVWFEEWLSAASKRYGV